MARRVERIAAAALGAQAARAAGAGLVRHLPRHRRAAAARICRAHRARSGLHHPRSRGFRRPAESRAPRARPLGDREALSDQGHLPRDLFARGQCRGAARRGAGATPFPGAPAGRRSCASCSRAYVEAKQRQNVLDYDDLLLYWAQMMAEPAHRRRRRRALRSRAGRRVPGHQPAAGLDPARAEAGRARPDRGRRRRAVDLFVPRRDRAQHPRLSRAVLAAGRRSSRWSATIARRSRSSPPPMP